MSDSRPYMPASALPDSCLTRYFLDMPLPKAPAHPAEILEDYGTPATPESERKLPDVKIVNAMESHPAAAVKTGKRRNVKAARSAEPLPSDSRL